MGFEECDWRCGSDIWSIRYLDENDLGVCVGADGMMRIAPGLVRIPDVSFIAWDKLPGRESPKEPIPDLAPDLAVEVLSEGNTKAEMARKVREYFEAGVILVWLIDPKKRTAQGLFDVVEKSVLVRADQVISTAVTSCRASSVRLSDLLDRGRRPRRRLIAGTSEIKLVDVVLGKEIRLAEQDVVALDLDRAEPAGGQAGGAWFQAFRPSRRGRPGPSGSRGPWCSRGRRSR